MTLTIALSMRDYAALYRQLLDKKYFIISAVPLIITIPLGAFVLVYTGLKSNAPLLLMLLPFALIVALLVWLFYRVLYMTPRRQFREAMQAFGAMFDFTLETEILRCAAGENRFEIAYGDLDRAVETPKHIFLFTEPGKAFIFPKSSLESGALDFLREKCIMQTDNCQNA